MSVALQPVSAGIPVLFLIVVALVAMLVLLPAWLLLTRRSASGDATRASDAQRVPLIYGYTVCLVCLVVALTSASTLFDHALRLRSPLVSASDWPNPYDVSLTSFEAYRATVGRAATLRTPEAPPAADTLPEAVHRARYEALRADRIATVEAMAYRKLVSSATMLLVAMGLFVVHWRWIRTRAAHATGSGPSA